MSQVSSFKVIREVVGSEIGGRGHPLFSTRHLSGLGVRCSRHP
jgi:hypothetical protein